MDHGELRTGVNAINSYKRITWAVGTKVGQRGQYTPAMFEQKIESLMVSQHARPGQAEEAEEDR